jgi:hypothetical protein
MDLLLIHICLIGFGICLGSAATAIFLLHRAKKDNEYIIKLFHALTARHPFFPEDLQDAMRRVSNEIH